VISCVRVLHLSTTDRPARDPHWWGLSRPTTWHFYKYPDALASRTENSGGKLDILAPRHPDTFENAKYPGNAGKASVPYSLKDLRKDLEEDNKAEGGG